MATILETLACIAPEFDTIPVATRECIIEIAENQIDQETFGADYNAAVAYLSAHMLTIREYKKGNVAGAATMLKEGDLQASFSTPEAIDNTSLSDTSYGREFLRIRDLHVIGAICAS